MIKSVVIGLFGLSVAVVGCNSGESTGQGTGRLALDVRCNQDADCPQAFQCEIEVEHGVSQSFCVQHQSDDANGASLTCPAGFEAEADDKGTLCKAHGGGAGGSGSGVDDSSTSAGIDDSSSGTGIDDTSSSSTGGASGTTPVGGACTSTADCAVGLQCEAQVEHGVTTMVCSASGKKI